ncbi:hypothetical protein [Rhizobium sp. BK376]|uniref:hypothetical protein n=1 Tax=Rhizobium sp. BK376 TaxID=2512149 RepID=UPI00104CE4AA|nr:hypothetical protein [Rhizobium sp. BK376]
MEDVAALFFGAIIIMFFSYERFNRVTYDGGPQLKRLITILSPDRLRARRVVVNAYLFYALALEVIYFFLCIYAKPLPALGGPNLLSAEVGASKLPTDSSETANSLVNGFDQATDLWVRTLSTSDAALAANPGAAPHWTSRPANRIFAGKIRGSSRPPRDARANSFLHIGERRVDRQV